MTKKGGGRGRDFDDALREDGADAVRAAIEEATPVVKLPWGYHFEREGLYFQPSDDKPPERIAGRFDVEAETRDERGGQWGLLIAWKDGDGRAHRWAMPKSMLAGDGFSAREELLGRGLFIAASKAARARLVDFLGSVSASARAWASDRIGWVDGAFCLPDRTIGDRPAERVIYQSAEGASDHAYVAGGTIDGWRGGVAAPAAGNTRLVLAVAGAFVGPLLGLLDEEGGGVHLRGPSSIGKSTALITGASVWGRPSRYVRQWRATGNAIEGVCAGHSETLLLLDELAQLDPREAGAIAYLIANGQAKSRASRTGGLRAPMTWRVFFLSSGEIGLADLAQRDSRSARRPAAGQEIRILDIDADAGKGLGLFDHIAEQPSAERLARHIKEQCAAHHGHAGPAFVEALIARGLERAAEDTRALMRAFAEAHVPAGSTGQVARAGRRFALIAAAGEMATELGILPWTKGEASHATAAIFRQWIAQRGGTGPVEDSNAIAQVRAFMEAHGSSRFEVIRRDHDDAERLGDGRSIMNRAGFRKDDIETGQREYYIMRESWSEVCAGIDPKRTARLLIEKGMMRPDSQGGSTCPISLPGFGKVRVYVILPSLFTEDAD